MSKTPASRSPKQRRSKERVAHILDATSAVLREDGIKRLTTNSIAARAKIPVSSIYQYFPNKEAILATLYEQYLVQVRESYVSLDTADTREMPWRDYCNKLITELLAVDTQDNIDEEFEVALELYPELMALDKAHEEWMANHLADDFRRLGSGWPRARLKRLAHLVYEYNSAVWRYRANHSPPNKELFEWTQTTFIALAGQCFESP